MDPIISLSENSIFGNNETTFDATYECEVFSISYIEEKVILVAIAGTFICMTSIIGNCLLLYIFLTRPHLRETHFYYMTWLSGMDIFTSISYLLLMSVMIIMVRFHILTLYQLWFTYVREVFAFVHVLMLCSSYLIVVANVERYCK
jgi:hypothetical protein